MPPLSPDPSLYTQIGTIVLVRLAKYNATSLVGGIMDLKEGAYLGLLQTGKIASISFGLILAK